MNYDAFSKRHPLVNFLFFIGAIGCGVVIQHPAYLIAGVFGAGIYYLLLHGSKSWKMIFGMLPMFLILTGINPLLNTDGQNTLFYVLGRPYTLEALMYGAAIAGVFVATLLWFGCSSAVLTSDKFTSLFGSFIPSLSLLLVMVLHMIPNFLRKAKQIIGARKCIGKGTGNESTIKEKVNDGMVVLSALTDWALEGSVTTGDSMRTRGYGSTKRSSFQIYHMTAMDRILIVLMIMMLLAVIVCAANGAATVVYTPELYIAPISGEYLAGYIAYCAFLLMPTALYIKEAILWHISRSKI